MATPLPQTDFSYERDVAPYAGRFFGQMQQDTRLSPAARQRLQSGLLSGVTAIETQRMKLQEERDQSVLRRLQMENSMLELEENRSKLERRKQLLQNSSNLNSEIDSIVRSNESPLTRKQKLADLQYKYGDLIGLDPMIGNKFKVADETIIIPKTTKENLTTTQAIEAAKNKVDPRIIDAVQQGLAPATLIGDAIAENVEAERLKKEKDEQVAKDLAANKQRRIQLIDTPLEFAKPRDTGEDDIFDSTGKPIGTRRWLKPESTSIANQIILMGTEEERKAYEKATNDDEARYRIIEGIKLREQRSLLQGRSLGGMGAQKKVSAAGLVNP